MSKSDVIMNTLLSRLDGRRIALSDALRMFREYKLDTLQISKLCQVPEHEVVRKLDELRRNELMAAPQD